MTDAIKLRAINAEDLNVFSSLLQDAVIRVGDITWQASDHRFVTLCNRYRWERKKGIWPFRKKPERVRTALHFNGILSVESNGYDINDSEAFLNLLAIHNKVTPSGETYLQLDFSAGATIRLHYECIDGVLSDISESWQAIREPQHK